MKESMKQLQITALAREYAEWMIKDAKCENLPNCLKKAMLASNTEYVEEVIRWLLSRYNLVEKSAYAFGREKEAITQQEIEKAAKEFAERECEIGQVDRDALYKGYYHGMKDSLGKQEKDAEETVIPGWVARNENGVLTAYNNKPIRQAFGDCLGWFGHLVMVLDESLFPDLTWNDDPQEVKIIIKKKKNE